MPPRPATHSLLLASSTGHAHRHQREDPHDTHAHTPQRRHAHFRHDNIFATPPLKHTAIITHTARRNRNRQADSQAKREKGTHRETHIHGGHTRRQAHREPDRQIPATVLTSLCACFNGRFLGLGILTSPPQTIPPVLRLTTIPLDHQHHRHHHPTHHDTPAAAPVRGLRGSQPTTTTQ